MKTTISVNSAKVIRLPIDPEKRERCLRIIIGGNNVPNTANTVACKGQWPKLFKSLNQYSKDQCAKFSIIPT